MMADTNLEQNSAYDYARLVDFEWGSNVVRYTDWGEDLTVNSNTYTSLTTLETNIGKITLGTEDNDSTIAMPTEQSPADRLTRGPYRGDVEVTIRDVSPSDLSNPRTLFRGYVRSVRRNPNGNEDIAEITVASMKVKLKRQVGLIASRTDNYWLGHPANNIDTSSYQLSGTMSGIGHDGKPFRVLIVFADGTTYTDARYQRGYVEYDGERIGIRKSLGGGVFDLEGIVDQSWQGQTVTVHPGWDGTLATARSVWSGESLETYFTGIGYNMPTRNPVFAGA